MRKVGFFPKEMKKSDIHGQAERLCKFFGYKTVYEYNAHPIYAHITYSEVHRPSWVNEKGEYKQAPFVEKIGGRTEE